MTSVQIFCRYHLLAACHRVTQDINFQTRQLFIIEKIKKLYYNILTERDKEDLKMFDDFDTMIQSDELAALYFFEDDSDGQEDI